jgi:hypothetical protein
MYLYSSYFARNYEINSVAGVVARSTPPCILTEIMPLPVHIIIFPLSYTLSLSGKLGVVR